MVSFGFSCHLCWELPYLLSEKPVLSCLVSQIRSYFCTAFNVQFGYSSYCASAFSFPEFCHSLFWEVHTFIAFSNPSGLSTNQTSFVLKDYLLAHDTDLSDSQLSSRQPCATVFIQYNDVYVMLGMSIWHLLVCILKLKMWVFTNSLFSRDIAVYLNVQMSYLCHCFTQSNWEVAGRMQFLYCMFRKVFTFTQQQAEMVSHIVLVST